MAKRLVKFLDGFWCRTREDLVGRVELDDLGDGSGDFAVGGFGDSA